MPYYTEIRDAHINDHRCFNNLLSNSGGIPLYRAIFGQFTFSALVEYSLMSLVAVIGEGEDLECHAAVAVNDSTSASADSSSFEIVIEQLQQVMKIEVFI